MQPRDPRMEVPWMVRFTTMGRPSTRERMLFSLVMMLALTVVAAAIWLGDPELAWYQFMLLIGLGLSVAEALSIRWIDRHGEWSS